MRSASFVACVNFILQVLLGLKMYYTQLLLQTMYHYHKQYHKLEINAQFETSFYAGKIQKNTLKDASKSNESMKRYEQRR